MTKNNTPKLDPLLNVTADDLYKTIHDWYDVLRYERHVSEHTLRAYQKDIKNFVTFLAKYYGAALSVGMVSDSDITALRAWLAGLTIDGEQSASSRARALSAVRRFIDWMDKQGIAHNPYIKAIRAPKQGRKLPRPISAERIFELLNDYDSANWIDCRDKALFTLLYGTDAAVLPHDMGGWQFATMVGRGMRPMDAIWSATSVAAEHMGLSADVGAVAPGRVADLIAVRGAPLADAEILRDVAVVMQAGVIVKAPGAD